MRISKSLEELMASLPPKRPDPIEEVIKLQQEQIRLLQQIAQTQQQMMEEIEKENGNVEPV